MSHYKFNVDIWVEGDSEKDAENNMLAILEPETEVIGWELLYKDDYEED